LRRKPIKIGAEVVSHGRCVTFGVAEVATSRKALKEILMLIARRGPRRHRRHRHEEPGVRCDK
jgi:hypothetical protein